MFGNFIYPIIALLMYSAYQPPEHHGTGFVESIISFIAMTGFYFLLTRMVFRHLAGQAREARTGNRAQDLDYRFDRALSRQTMVAILMFAFAIHLLNLPYFFRETFLFDPIPTLGDLFFILLFVCLLALTWSEAYTAHRAVYHTDMGRMAYVRSQISFFLPVLLPWLFLSLMFDLLRALPFQRLGQLLTTGFGETLFFLIMLVFIVVPAPVLVKLIWGCKPLEKSICRTRIEEFCRTSGFEYADILSWPLFGGRMVTAGVMGLIRRFRYILVTPALLEILTPEEVDAVIAHEIAHVKKHHLFFYLLFVVGFLILLHGVINGLLYGVVHFQPIYHLANSVASLNARVSPSLMSMIFTVLFFWMYFRYVFGFFMRNFERQADIYALGLLGTSEPLIRTFRKIVLASGQSPEKPNWHHFSIRERMNYLLKCEADKRWVMRHDRKVRRAVALYFGCLLLIGFAGWHLNFGESSRLFNSMVLENAVLREIETHPDDFRLYAMLGDVLQGRGQLVEAAAAYERSLSLNRDNAYVLNNYAWLLTTSDDPNARDPVRALDMARQAVVLDPSSHIWDTLAEALYANGYVAEAVDAAGKALEAAKDNQTYYRGQLVRFQSAAGVI